MVEITFAGEGLRLAVGGEAGAAVNAADDAAVSAALALAAASEAAQAVIPGYVRAMRSAVGAGTIRALFDMDGPRTGYAGSETILTQLDSLDATPLSLTLHSTLSSYADPRPVWNARGIYLNANSGLGIANGLLPTTAGDFALLWCGDLNTVTGTTATEAALAGGVDGDIQLVNADTNTGFSPDVDTVLDQDFVDGDLINGYFRNTFAGWNNHGPHYLFALTGTGGAYVRCGLTHLGQIFVFLYPGSGAGVLLSSKGTVVIGGRRALAISRIGDALRLHLDGKFLMGIDISGLPAMTTLNQLYVNGPSRDANPAYPVSGWRQYFRGLVVADGISQAGFDALHAAFNERHERPQPVRARRMRGAIMSGQSWSDGATAVAGTDSWTTAPGWDGEVDLDNATYSGEDISVTREAFPNVFTSRLWSEYPADIAPYAIRQNSFGDAIAASTHSPNLSGENLAAGWAKQVNAHRQGPLFDWFLIGGAIGGASLANLSAEPTAWLVQELKTAPLALGEYYAKTLRQIVHARDFAWGRGQEFGVDLLVWQQGHSDVANAAYAADFLAYYDKLAAAVKRITGQSHDPTCIIPQVNYAGPASGADNGWIAIDQRILDIETGRGPRPIFCFGPMYPITSFIHPYRAAHRWIGELAGLATAQTLFDGQQYLALRPLSYAYALGGTTIDVNWPIRSGRALTLGLTNDNAIDAALARHGFVFTDTSGGGVTISAVAVTDDGSGDGVGTIRVTVSGAIGAGDFLGYTGVGARYGNVADGAKVDGIYRDQDWTAPFTGNSPKFANGNLTDLRRWACAFRKELT